MTSLFLCSELGGGGGGEEGGMKLSYERGRNARRSLRGVNCGFWSHLGSSGQNAIIFSCDGCTFRIAREEI